jgi:hypothetical protein
MLALILVLSRPAIAYGFFPTRTWTALSKSASVSCPSVPLAARPASISALASAAAALPHCASVPGSSITMIPLRVASPISGFPNGLMTVWSPPPGRHSCLFHPPPSSAAAICSTSACGSESGSVAKSNGVPANGRTASAIWACCSGVKERGASFSSSAMILDCCALISINCEPLTTSSEIKRAKLNATSATTPQITNLWDARFRHVSIGADSQTMPAATQPAAIPSQTSNNALSTNTYGSAFIIVVICAHIVAIVGVGLSFAVASWSLIKSLCQ